MVAPRLAPLEVGPPVDLDDLRLPETPLHPLQPGVSYETVSHVTLSGCRLTVLQALSVVGKALNVLLLLGLGNVALLVAVLPPS